MKNLFGDRNNPRMLRHAGSNLPVHIDAGEDALQPGSNDRFDINPYTGSDPGREIEVLPPNLKTTIPATKGMAVLAPPKNQPLFEPSATLAPAGTFNAVCIDIRDVFGVERRKFQSEAVEKVNLTAFLFEFRDPAGNVHRIASRTFRISGSEKSGLYKLLADWLGQPPRMGWDYQELKDHQAQITIEHTASKGAPEKVYADLVRIGPVAGPANAAGVKKEDLASEVLPF